jgi:CRP-like cAMP-binding protein/Fe-S-cluster-containing hydrogenase component 2
VAKQVILMPPARLEPRPTDVKLPDDQLLKLSLFAQLKRKPTLDKFPGTIVIRRFRKGEEICRQGEAGWTAFSMLTTEDALAVIEARLPAAQGAEARQLLKEKEEFTRQLARIKGAPDDDTQRRVVTVRLTVARPRPPRPESALRRLIRRLGKRPDVGESQRPISIAIDAPTMIDAETLQAPMFEGELFGEMSCMYGTPRSATITADRDCYAIEMLRNILDQLQKDPQYKAHVDELYKKRVFDLHLRRLSLFADLTDEQFAEVRDQVELLTIDANQILFDEHERPDAVYIIRSGLVQVLKKTSALLAQEHVRTWKSLGEQLLAARDQPTTPAGKVWQMLTAEARGVVSLQLQGLWPEPSRLELLYSLNDIIKSRAFPDAPELKPVLADATFKARTESFTGDRKKWPEQSVRRFNRILMETVFPGLFRHYRERVGPECVLFYCSRGEYIGEMGLLEKRPRSATCMAYGHPDELAGGKEAGRVELVRIPAKTFARLLKEAPAVRQRIERAAAERAKRTESRVTTPVWEDPGEGMFSERFEQLGLIQGQRLMVIDLDRCTRCDECVRACVDTHEDGYSRLFLDGPRFGKYLVPASCRSCLDPVCMIGCPVGSIHRGNNGQIQIEDWCIGCGLCAKQCPYGSIHMHDIGVIAEEGPVWQYHPATDAGGDAWTRPGFKDRTWLAARAPVMNDRDFRDSLAPRMKPKGDKSRRGDLPASMGGGLAALLRVAAAGSFSLGGQGLRFRHVFRLTREMLPANAQFKLEVSSAGKAVKVWVNGQALEPAEKPKGGTTPFWLPTLPAGPGQPRGPQPLRRGWNVLAVEVSGPPENGGLLVKARLDEVRRPTVSTGQDVDVAQKMVTERAVVCDLCSDQLGQVPACVNACPHDAAIRVDARFEFPGQTTKTAAPDKK